MCDAIFLNPISFANYWKTPMKPGIDNVTVRLKQVLLPNIKMTKIDR